MELVLIYTSYGCLTLFQLQDLDEEAGYDDYYSDDNGLDEYEEEEEEVPPKEEVEYLELRQRIKESIRKKSGSGGVTAAQSSQDRRKKQLPYNEYVVAINHPSYKTSHGMCVFYSLITTSVSSCVFFLLQLWFLLWPFTACDILEGYSRKQILAGQRDKELQPTCMLCLTFVFTFLCSFLCVF